MDAELKQYLEAMEGRLDTRQEAMESRLDKRLDHVDGRLTSLDDRLTSLDGRLTSLDDRLTSLDDRVSHFDNLLTEKMRDMQTELLRGFAAMSEAQTIRLRKVEADQSNLDAALSGRVSVLEKRLLEIELRLGRV